MRDRSYCDAYSRQQCGAQYTAEHDFENVGFHVSIPSDMY